MSGAPPGYVDPEDEPRLSLGPSAAILVSATLSLALAFYEVGIATPRAYATSTPAWRSAAMALCSAALGAFAARHRARPELDASSALAVCSLSSSLSGLALTLSCASGQWLTLTSNALPVLFGVSAGFAAAAGLRAFAPGFLALDGVIYLLNPFRALCIALGTILLLLAFPWLGVLRRAALLGALLAGAALLTPLVSNWFDLYARLGRAQRVLLRLCPFVALAVLLGAERVVPLADVQRRNGDVLCVLDSEREHHAFVRLQQGLLLFSGELLATTSTDATRFAEALVHPALAAANERRRVLALDDGSGAVAREILRWREVRELSFLAHDPALVSLARRSPLLRELGAAALDDPRVRLETREAAVVLATTSTRYDVIVANLRDPTSYFDGKYFTVAVLRLFAQHLQPGGVFGLQITSAERTPKTHALIVETLKSAGFCVEPYRAPLATLGEWGFALAARSSEPETCARLTRPELFTVIPTGTALVTSRTLPGLFARLPLEPERPSAPSQLFEQPVVDAYQSEEHALE